jgi:hypothetical protein
MKINSIAYISFTDLYQPFSSAIYGQAPMLGFPQPAAGYANSSTIRHSRGAEDSDLARHQVNIVMFPRQHHILIR